MRVEPHPAARIALDHGLPYFDGFHSFPGFESRIACFEQLSRDPILDDRTAFAGSTFVFRVLRVLLALRRFLRIREQGE